MTPTMALRWIYRPDRMDGGKKETVLQQWWYANVTYEGEWRDVPVFDPRAQVTGAEGAPPITLALICPSPNCGKDLSKGGFGCGGVRGDCQGMIIFSRLHAEECEGCKAGEALTMGMHRRGKGNPTRACTARVTEGVTI